jgi:hypothetical protein
VSLYLIFCTRTHHFYLNYSSLHTSFNFFTLLNLWKVYIATRVGWFLSFK